MCSCSCPLGPPTTARPHCSLESGSPHLLVLGEPSHDSRVHDPIQEHGKWVNGKAVVTLVLVYHHQDLLIGCGHGFNGILQRANCGLLKRDHQEERALAVHFKNGSLLVWISSGAGIQMRQCSPRGWSRLLL